MTLLLVGLQLLVLAAIVAAWLIFDRKIVRTYRATLAALDHLQRLEEGSLRLDQAKADKGMAERLEAHIGALSWRLEQCRPLIEDADASRRQRVRDDYLPRVEGVEPRNRSVLFLHHSYYHFYYLSRELRRRGWDALTVSVHAADDAWAGYYHGEDVRLHSPDPVTFQRNIRDFFEHAVERFALLHFAGDGSLSFYPDHFPLEDPPDIAEWRRRGGKVAYTASGCNSLSTQTSVQRWSGAAGRPVCDVCSWQNEPSVCNDNKTLAWARKVEKYVDVVFGEGCPALDCLARLPGVREPASVCLDSHLWRPDLPIPVSHQLEREPGELIVYHAVGHYDARTRGGRNVKGTQAVFDAIKRLQAEGLKVRLEFVTGIKSTEVRFYQVQADVVIDQLNHGRYGANARESLMLGRPTICYINPAEEDSRFALHSLQELPIVSANEATLYDTLRQLLLDAPRREALGRAGRAYALKWHSAQACGHRYEQIYDMLMQGHEIIEPQDWVYPIE